MVNFERLMEKLFPVPETEKKVTSVLEGIAQSLKSTHPNIQIGPAFGVDGLDLLGRGLYTVPDGFLKSLFNRPLVAVFLGDKTYSRIVKVYDESIMDKIRIHLETHPPGFTYSLMLE